MIKCFSVNLPDQFTSLLRRNMDRPLMTPRELAMHISDVPTIKVLVERCFYEIDSELRLEYIIKSLGWHGFRDRLASVYLYYQEHGVFPEAFDLERSKPLFAFEEKVKDFAVGSFSRSFLLAFYLEMVKTSLDVGAIDHEDCTPLEIESSLVNYLSFARSRVIKIDWLLIMLAHFSHFLGKDELAQMVSERRDYKEIFDLLDEEEKEVMITNLLSYGQSIGEPDLFINDVI